VRVPRAPRTSAAAVTPLGWHPASGRSAPAPPPAFAATATAAAARILDRFGLPSEKERDASLRIELHHHRGILVDDPEVVLRVDADLRREQESVRALADFARELAGAIELEQPGAAVHERARRRHRHRPLA